MCAVLKDIKYHNPSLFYIRWYTSFSYYYANYFASKIDPQTNESLKKFWMRHVHLTIVQVVNIRVYCEYISLNPKQG